MSLQETDIAAAREVAKLAARTLKPLRTERTIRMLAKEMAAAWWEESLKANTAPPPGVPETYSPEVRSEMFRRMWPDQRVYVIICWPHFYRRAREQMISMLHHESGVNDHLKARIFDAVLEDWNEKGN
jgi:hypothetical protein